MMLPFKLPEGNRKLLLILVVVYLITRLPLLSILPFVQDEALYSIMIEEQAEHPTLIPTFLGYPVSWKPQLFFWTYALFSKLSFGILPLELVYRLPSFLFGLFSIAPLFFFLRNGGTSPTFSFLTVLVFLFSLSSIYPNGTLLTDSMLFFFMIISLYLYSERRLGSWRFLAAGVLVFMAFFVKLIIASMVPVLALAYIYLNERKSLTHAFFILSLLAVPAAAALHFAILDSAGLASEAYAEMGGHAISSSGVGNQIATSLATFMIGTAIWFSLSLFGLWKHWRSNPFMALWCAFIIFPLLGGTFMPWYFLPVLPAVSYFAVALLLKWDGKEKVDRFFWIFMSMALVLSMVLIIVSCSGTYNGFIPQKEAGMMLSGKENVLILGGYAPGIVSYKMLTEKETLGRPLDSGWILNFNNFTPDMAAEFSRDYHSDRYAVSDGSFTTFPTHLNSTYRKDTDLARFDYFVIVRTESGPIPVDFLSDAQLIYNKSDIAIYDAR